MRDCLVNHMRTGNRCCRRPAQSTNNQYSLARVEAPFSLWKSFRRCSRANKRVRETLADPSPFARRPGAGKVGHVAGFDKQPLH